MRRGKEEKNQKKRKIKKRAAVAGRRPLWVVV